LDTFRHIVELPDSQVSNCRIFLLNLRVPGVRQERLS
jgi:hypothetical protein